MVVVLRFTKFSDHVLPCFFDIAVFCMSIYKWVFFPQATEGEERLGRVVKRLDISIFNNLLIILHQCTG